MISSGIGTRVSYPAPVLSKYPLIHLLLSEDIRSYPEISQYPNRIHMKTYIYIYIYPNGPYVSDCYIDTNIKKYKVFPTISPPPHTHTRTHAHHTNDSYVHYIYMFTDFTIYQDTLFRRGVQKKKIYIYIYTQVARAQDHNQHIQGPWSSGGASVGSLCHGSCGAGGFWTSQKYCWYIADVLLFTRMTF